MLQFRDKLSEMKLTMKALSSEVTFTLKAHYKVAGRGVEHV